MLLKPLSILWFFSMKSIVSRQISGCLWKIQIVTISISDLNKTEKVLLLGSSPGMLFARAVTTVISSISPPLHNFSFSQTCSLMLLWPYWACASIAQGNSIERQNLLWVYPTERTETRLHFFYICFFICYIFMILLCCWVATAFQK